jgi:hypothetical protein
MAGAARSGSAIQRALQLTSQDQQLVRLSTDLA